MATVNTHRSTTLGTTLRARAAGRGNNVPVMVYLGRQVGDYLVANEEWRRTLRLSIRTDGLLRQGGGRLQALKQTRYLEQARNQIRDRMRTQHRRAFRGEVSVNLTIFASGIREAPSAPKSVKRYLDAMTGLAYRDDRQIAHLAVRRFADDHPYERRVRTAEEGVAATVRKGPSEAQPWVAIQVTPLRIYIADYDRAFRLRDGRDREWDRDRDEVAFWEDEDEFEVDRDQLRELLREREDDAQSRGLYAGDDDEFRQMMQRLRETQIDRLLTQQILGRRPTAWDRPGPDPFSYLGELAPGPLAVPGWRVNLPGEFWLPGPEETGWEDAVRRSMSAHRKRWPVLPSAFDEPLSLDIAAYGATGIHRDLDNLAHPILAAFERLYCADLRGTVTGYRTYRLDNEMTGVRVQVMPGERLQQLEDAMRGARDHVLARGPHGDW
jgi:hypothetical protein